MNPDIFKIVQVCWEPKDNTATEVTVEHIESGVKTTLTIKKKTEEK